MQGFSFPGVVPPPAPPAAPQQVDYKARAYQLIPERVSVIVPGGQRMRCASPEHVAWAYNHIQTKLQGTPSSMSMEQRIAAQLEAAAPDAYVIDITVTENAGQQVDYPAENMKLVRELLWKGTKISSAPADGQASLLAYLRSRLPASANVDKDLYEWLQKIGSGYELDDATRAAKTAQPPANPISTQTAPQQAAPIAPPVDDPAVPGAEDEYNPNGVLCPACKEKSKTVRGLKTHVTKTHKTDWPTFCVTYALDPKTGNAAAGAPLGTPSSTPTTPPPASPAVAPMLAQQPPAMFPATVTTGSPNNLGSPAAYPGVQQDIRSVPGVMPTPPPQVAMAPAAAVATPVVPVVTFDPSAPGDGTALVPGYANPQEQIATKPAAPPPAATGSAFREQAAQMLGGPVDLVIVRLLDTATVNLEGRADANQIALMAERAAREEMRISDLAQGSYGAGKQAAQRHFATLLSKYPRVYLLLNGFEPILPEGYLPIVIARTTRAVSVADQGRTMIELKLG